jgi:uncharacterized membrane protein
MDEIRPEELIEKVESDYFRFHLPYQHLSSIFGDDWFALKAESFARFFGTPVFLIGQTIFVAIWICLNAMGYTQFDIYPFILLNLAFSTQAAYAAPLILLAQTRQTERDNKHTDADAQHREYIASQNELRQIEINAKCDQILSLLKEKQYEI